MVSETFLVTVAALVALVGPMLGLTWYSVREDDHAPAALQRGELQEDATQ